MSKQYEDFSNVEVGREYIAAEQTPEGPYGSPIGKNQALTPKSSTPGQRSYSAFNYENKQLHEDIPRQWDGRHPIQDEKK